MTESCTGRFLQQIVKYSHGKKGKKPCQKPRIYLVNVAVYANIFFNANKKMQVSIALENRPILIARFAGSR